MLLQYSFFLGGCVPLWLLRTNPYSSRIENCTQGTPDVKSSGLNHSATLPPFTANYEARVNAPRASIVCWIGSKWSVLMGVSQAKLSLMLHGVRQGSILGPLFFILFIDDLPLYTRAQLVLYADDTTVTASADVKNLATLNSSLIQISLSLKFNYVIFLI